jgi:exodeoxyribonuclease V alpha subunit
VWQANQSGNDHQQALVLDQDRLYLRRYWSDETSVALAINRRAAAPRQIDNELTQQWLGKLFTSADKNLDSEPDWQKIACAIALRSQLTIITGGPGTGKTYTVARLLALLFALSDKRDSLRIALAAPTGKAAARLKQSIDDALNELAPKLGESLPLAELTKRMGAARTLHSLLGARPDTRAFAQHSGNQLEIDVLIVDEASMVHLEMMAAILAALPDKAMLILLGDKDQLASVEAGAVLGDLCRNAENGDYSAQTLAYVTQASGETIPATYLQQHGNALSQQTVMLRKSRRFSGPIGSLALAVNSGHAAQAMACLRSKTGDNNDDILSWISHAQPKEMMQLALNGRPDATGGYRSYLTLLKEMPQPVGGVANIAAHEQWALEVLQSFESFRILCAVREGVWGVAGLNQAIEQRLESEKLIRRHSEWYVGRPVMITRNDHGTGVFNGDIGICLPDPLRKEAQRVYFLEGKAVRSVLATRLRNVVTAYAMTVHKSQGSEFSHTVMVLPEVSSPVVSRELVYTGITRARTHFTLVSPVPSVFEEALNNRTQRASGLGSLLNN